MSDVQQNDGPQADVGYLEHSLSLADIWRAVSNSWLLIGGSMLLCGVLAALYLMMTPPQYTTDMIVAPQQGSQASGRSSGLGALGGVTGLLGLASGNGTDDFEKFRTLFTSIQTAQRVDADLHLLRKFYPGWDDGSQSWKMPPLSLGNVVPRTVRLLLGRPVWREPGAGDLSAYLTSKITLTKGDDNGFVIVATESSDPEFSEKLLRESTDATNEILRQKAQQQASVQIAYLNRELGTVSNADHRQVLSTLLLQQEQNMMLSRSNLPYAAQILSPPTTHYDQPHPGLSLTLGGGLIAGFMLGLLGVFVREARKRERGMFEMA